MHDIEAAYQYISTLSHRHTHIHTYTYKELVEESLLQVLLVKSAQCLNLELRFAYALRNVGNIPLYREKINDSQWSLRRWKRFKLEKSFDRFSSHSFSFIRRGEKVFTKTFSFLLAIMGFYMIAYEKILGIVRSSRLMQRSSAANKSLVQQKQNLDRDPTIFGAQNAMPFIDTRFVHCSCYRFEKKKNIILQIIVC